MAKKSDARVLKKTGSFYYHCDWQLVATSAPTVILQSIETSAANVSFGGITAGMICQVIVNAVGTAGTSDWSGGTNQMVI